ncbi:MAG: hypothetical protein QW279_05290, partial [Candidatus Jordarchaeaceae archaeon]
MNRVRVGIVLMIISLVLFSVGINQYLNNTKLTTGPIQGTEYSKTWQIDAGEYDYLWYNVTLTEMELNSSILFSFEEINEKQVDFYVMSSSQFYSWKNTSIANSLIARTNSSSQIISFYPNNNDTYYFVVDNSQYNTTKTLYVKSNWLSIVFLLDHSQVTAWLLTAMTGVLLFFVSCVLAGNPVNILLRKIIQTCRIPAIFKPAIFKQGNHRLREIRIKYELILFWIAVIVQLGYLSVILLSKIPSIWEVPGEFTSSILDLLLRIFLFYFFGVILPLSIFIPIGFILFNVSMDIDKWLIQKRGIGVQAEESQFLFCRNLANYLKAQRSMPFYALALILFAVGYLQGAGLLFYLAGTIFLSIPYGYSSFAAAKDTFKTQNMDVGKNFKVKQTNDLNSMVIILWFLPGLIVLVKVIVSLAIPVAYGY